MIKRAGKLKVEKLQQQMGRLEKLFKKLKKKALMLKKLMMKLKKMMLTQMETVTQLTHIQIEL